MQKKRAFSLAGSQAQIWIRPGENPGAIFREALTLSAAVSAPNFTGSKMAGLDPQKPGQSGYAVQATAFSLQNVNSLVRILMGKGMPLQRQPEDYQGPFKVSYYYPEGASMAVDFATIQALADERGIRVVFTRCNPAVGDPPDCYDVEFIPLCCGKDQAVSFLMEETALPKEAIIAFGDSANDFAMFAQAGRGYQVGNADPFAIRQYSSSLNAAYCHGILKGATGMIIGIVGCGGDCPRPCQCTLSESAGHRTGPVRCECR
ncbi:sucrose-6F-phosphate phosphohydrolase (plasmid) [Salmonella enterica subsp. enterica serovar Gaminara]|nr:sucrose-6F-phosphate phosphohydrolase [Salmonella enterica subsp. enterica serovar Gaminara]ESH15187.1 putative hydrolase [Salmonella enterica subsp. enterica serovar Gaminara str. ATCC BAA-711]OSD46612.1 sucrose-6F-phosphate phosphohydrolase [Salmonella enterica subsp. enterica serovar Gaminara]